MVLSTLPLSNASGKWAGSPLSCPLLVRGCHSHSMLPPGQEGHVIPVPLPLSEGCKQRGHVTLWVQAVGGGRHMTPAVPDTTYHYPWLAFHRPHPRPGAHCSFTVELVSPNRCVLCLLACRSSPDSSSSCQFSSASTVASLTLAPYRLSSLSH